VRSARSTAGAEQLDEAREVAGDDVGPADLDRLEPPADPYRSSFSRLQRDDIGDPQRDARRGQLVEDSRPRVRLPVVLAIVQQAETRARIDVEAELADGAAARGLDRHLERRADPGTVSPLLQRAARRRQQYAVGILVIERIEHADLERRISARANVSLAARPS
jgi:hypothetical protein